MPKCVSKCQSLKIEHCNKTKYCKVVNGTKKNYCRLSNEYKMDSSCNPTRKLKKGEVISTTRKNGKKITEKLKKLKSQLNHLSVMKPISPLGPSSTERQLALLTTICSDSGECMALGREMDTMRNFFNGFTDFQYVEPPIKQIGKVSSNGFVKEIKYTREGYSSYAVLKSARRRISDNLVYEYQVGQYINKQCNRFPCFVETYELYYYNNKPSWDIMKNNPVIPQNILDTIMKEEKTIHYGKACKKGKNVALLIQHVNGMTLQEMLFNPPHSRFINSELPFIILQIYFPLVVLIDTFTHYDLHLKNVLIYTLDNQKCIEYHYHFKNGKIISFKSRYIAKIIDYGRSFFDDKESNMNSDKIYKELCKLKSCDPNCGESFGFGWLSEVMSKDYYYIDSTQKNNSHDLRLLNEMKILRIHKKLVNNFKKLFTRLIYTHEFGTQPLDPGYPNYIQNIQDVVYSVIHSIETDASIYAGINRLYSGVQKIGDLHVYEDLPMQFIPTNVVNYGSSIP